MSAYRDTNAQYNLMAGSLMVRESGINTFRAPDIGLVVETSDHLKVEGRYNTNEGRMTGTKEPTKQNARGYLSNATWNFKEATPTDIACMLAYALGDVSVAPNGSAYTHTIKALKGKIDKARALPTFTAMEKFSEVEKLICHSMAVSQTTLDFTSDSYLNLSAQLVGTGKHEYNFIEEEITAMDDVTQLTLDTNGVNGADADERMKNVQFIDVALEQVNGVDVWTPVAFSEVSAATPAVITITAPGSTTTAVKYRVTYVPTEAAKWTFPAIISENESGLLVTGTQAVIGGVWDGTDFKGGRTENMDISSFKWTYNNNAEAVYTFGAGQGVDHASRIKQGKLTQSLEFNREFTDVVYNATRRRNETFGLKLTTLGAEIETGIFYEVTLVFPRLAINKYDNTTDGESNAEAIGIQVLEDTQYGSVIVTVVNEVEKFAAAA